MKGRFSAVTDFELRYKRIWMFPLCAVLASLIAAACFYVTVSMNGIGINISIFRLCGIYGGAFSAFIAVIGCFFGARSSAFLGEPEKRELMLSLPVGRLHIIFASALGQMIMMLATLFVACAALLILDICVYGNVSETLGCFWSFALTALTELLLYFSLGLFAGTVSEGYAPMTVLCVSFWLTRAAVRAMLSVKAARVENSWLINYYTSKSRLAFYPLTPNGMWASFEQQRLMTFIVSLGVAVFIAALAVVALKYGRLERKKRGYHSAAVACAVKVSVMISVFFLATVFFNDNIVYVIRMFTELSVYPVLQVFEENAVLYYCVGSSLVAFLVTSMLTGNLREVVRDAALLPVYALLSAVAGKLIIAYCFW